MAPYPDDNENLTQLNSSISESEKSPENSAQNSNSSPDQYDLTHMDSAGDYSLSSTTESIQMAQYLDDVESGGAETCSFQDVNLNESPVKSSGSPSEEEVRRARKRYYLLPMLIKYSLPIGGFLLGIMVLMVTIGVTASVVRSQDEKRLQSLPEIQGDGSLGGSGGLINSGVWDDKLGDEGVGDWLESTPDYGDEEVGDFGVYDDAPVFDDVGSSFDDYMVVDGEGDEEVGEALQFETPTADQSQTQDDNTMVLDDYVVAIDEEGDVEVGDALEHTPVTDDEYGDEELSAPIEFTSPTDDTVTGTHDVEATTGDELEVVGTPLEFTSSDDEEEVDRTDSLDDAFSGSTTGEDDLDTSNINNGGSTSGPQWYSTSHASYVSLLDFHTSTSANVSPHHTAGLFCNNMGQKLCSYSTYCPSGKYGEPYNNGPKGLFNMAQEEWEQWAPVFTNGQGVEWVQVGKIVDADGEYGGRCRTYDEWSGGDSVVEDSVGAEHRRYILCCDSSQDD